MRRSNRLIILLGIFLAVAGGLLTAVVVTSGGGSGGTASGTPTPAPEPTVKVVVAKQDITLGDTITAAMVETKTLTVSQAAALGSDTFTDPTQVIGKIAGSNITAGQVLLASRDFLAAGTMAEGQDISQAVATGMVGVSMLVDQQNGVGTLLVPGDHVDVILSVYVPQISLTAKDGNGNSIALAGGNDVTTKMVMQNRRILATLLPPVEIGAAQATPAPVGSPGAKAAPTAGLVQNTGRQMIVILEVKPEEAEILRWAQRAEKQDPQNYIDLSLALVSGKDTAAADTSTTGITFKMLVDKYGVLPPDPRAILPSDLTKGISW